MPERKRVLVLCTGNACRSQMAEGWIRHDLGEWVDVFSAGVHPCYVHPYAIRVMAEVGVDIATHRSKSVREFLDEDFDLVITVCDSAREACPYLPGARSLIHEPIPDPVTEGPQRFREVRDLIRERIVALVKRELCQKII